MLGGDGEWWCLGGLGRTTDTGANHWDNTGARGVGTGYEKIGVDWRDKGNLFSISVDIHTDVCV